MKINNIEYFTLSEAADYVSPPVSKQRIHKMYWNDYFYGTKNMGRLTLIPRHELDRFSSERVSDSSGRRGPFVSKFMNIVEEVKKHPYRVNEIFERQDFPDNLKKNERLYYLQMIKFNHDVFSFLDGKYFSSKKFNKQALRFNPDLAEKHYVKKLAGDL